MSEQHLNLPLPVLVLSDEDLETLIEDRNHQTESDDYDYYDSYN